MADDRNWYVCMEPPCPHCLLDFPHRHEIDGDGNPTNLVQRLHSDGSVQHPHEVPR